MIAESPRYRHHPIYNEEHIPQFVSRPSAKRGYGYDLGWYYLYNGHTRWWGHAISESAIILHVRDALKRGSVFYYEGDL